MDSKQQHHNICTELIESRIRQDNEILCAMNRELVTRLEEARTTIEQQRDSLRRNRDINRMQGVQNAELLLQIGIAERRILDHEHWDDIHYAVMREYFINNGEARGRWDDLVSFSDENYEAAVLDNEMLGIQYDGRNDLPTDIESSDDETTLEELIAAQIEEDDIANNWL